MSRKKRQRKRTNHPGRRESSAGQDPWLEDFQRSPYDPLYSARASGRVTGLAVKHVFRRGWMRFLVVLVIVEFIGSSLLSPLSLPTGVAPLLIAIPFAVFALRLLVNALRR
jgi:hypothetical protein